MNYRFEVFGREMLIKRLEGNWVLFTVSGKGLLSRVGDIAIPAELSPQELRSFLDDMYHEQASTAHPEVIRLD